MAHFYMTVNNGRSDKTMTGHKTNGIEAHIRGWNVGARVSIRYNPATDTDEVTVYKTAGSNGAGRDLLVADFTDKDDTME